MTTATFNFNGVTTNPAATGSEQTFVVPAGVTSLHCVVTGAGAYYGDQRIYGYGDVIECDLTVTPGETLRLYVGSRPLANGAGWSSGGGGYNGGGDSGSSASGVGGLLGHGGAGATDIRRGGAGVGNRVIVAAGCGGAAEVDSSNGGDANGTTGSNGHSGFLSGTTGGLGGAGGTPSAGGAGGANVGSAPASYGANGDTGTVGRGGDGGISGGIGTHYYGGGGGGGYHGGGGGGGSNPNTNINYTAGGGGGGSSYTHPTQTSGVTITSGSNNGQGQIVLTYTTPVTVTCNQKSSQADPTSTSPIVFRVVFSEAVTGFDLWGLTLGGTALPSTASIAVVSSTTYDVSVSGMVSPGTVKLSVGAGAAASVATGTPSLASTSTDNTVTYTGAGTGPAGSDISVTINQASAQTDPTGVGPVHFTVVFGAQVTGFDPSDVVITGTAGANAAVITGGPSTYDVAVSGMTGAGTVIADIYSGVATAANGHTNAGSTSTDNTVTYDPAIIPSTLSVTINQASGQADPTASTPIAFDIVFSETPAAFTLDEARSCISISGTAGANAISSLSGSGATYTILVVGMSRPGTVTVSMSGGIVTSVDARTFPAATSTDATVTYNRTQPTVTINQAAGQADPTNSSPISFTVVFSEAVTGFTSDDVILSGTASPNVVVVGGGPTTYTVSVSGMASAGTVSATIREAAASAVADGVSTAASTSTDNTVTYNPANPTVTVEQAPGQDDPTNVSPIHFVVTFSADVVDFATGDVTVNGSAQPTTAIVVPAYDPGHSRKFDVYVSGMIRSGTVTAVVRAGKAHDTSNNPNLRSTSVDNVVTYQQIVGGKVFGTGVNELPYESITLIDDERLLFNQAQFSRVSGAIQQVDDFTSQREFFTRSLVKSNLLLTTDDEALQLAEGVVVKYSQPHTLLTEMVLNPAGNDELYKYALQLDIGQSIRVRVRPPGITVGTYTEYIVCIQGVEHHVTRGLLSIIWQLSTVGIVQP